MLPPYCSLPLLLLLVSGAPVGVGAQTLLDLTDADRQALVDAHNIHRTFVSPPATNMIRAQWDPTLETIAGDYALNCAFDHNPNLGSVGAGENLYITSLTDLLAEDALTRADEAWGDEVHNYTYSSNSCDPGAVCGHYTQIVWQNSYMVGCAVVECPEFTSQVVPNIAIFNNGHMVVCNYRDPGNFIGQQPYAQGMACEACPDTHPNCVSQLCTAPEPTTVTAEPTTVTTEPTTVTTEPTAVTDEPSTMTTEPTTVTDEPTTVTDEPSTMTTEPTTVTTEPTTVTTEPTTVTTEPTTMTTEPTTVTTEPTTVTTEPTTVTSEPTTVTTEPTTVTTEPTTVTTEPTTVTTEPTTVTTEPTTVTTEPTTVTTEPTTVTTEPTTVTTEPTTVTTEPTTVTTEPTTVTTEPTTVTTEPTTVTTEPTTVTTEPTTVTSDPITAPLDPTSAPSDPTTSLPDITTDGTSSISRAVLTVTQDGVPSNLETAIADILTDVLFDHCNSQPTQTCCPTGGLQEILVTVTALNDDNVYSVEGQARCSGSSRRRRRQTGQVITVPLSPEVVVAAVEASPLEVAQALAVCCEATLQEVGVADVIDGNVVNMADGSSSAPSPGTEPPSPTLDPSGPFDPFNPFPPAQSPPSPPDTPDRRAIIWGSVGGIVAVLGIIIVVIILCLCYSRPAKLPILYTYTRQPAYQTSSPFTSAYQTSPPLATTYQTTPGDPVLLTPGMVRRYNSQMPSPQFNFRNQTNAFYQAQ